jgi:hypothetical protein
MAFPNGKHTAIALAATALFATACGDHEQSVVSPALRAPTQAPSFNLVTTTTNWDFVALAGGEGPQGNPKTFTIAGAGSVVASAAPPGGLAFPNQVQVFSKGFALPPGSEERGLGLCREFGPGGDCLGGSDDEIGDPWPDGFSPALFLDFTGLAAGTTVQSVTLSSLQLSEGWLISASTDGSTYTQLSTGTADGTSTYEPTFTIAVPATTKFLQISPGPGSGGNNYLVQSVTTVTTTNTGKTFSIGPSSMEGAIVIANGDWVNGGYSFSFVSGGHGPTDFSVHATVSITGACIGGGPPTDTFTFTLNDATYSVPAGNTSWLPTGDQNSVLSWQGSVIASGICGGVGKLNASHGAVFTATVSQSPATGSLVNFRFKYRDPAAKGKPNTNCLDTTDPNRAKADVCGASWSQTVKDP